jgi:hypothetical protein
VGARSARRVSPLRHAANTDPDEFADPDVVDQRAAPTGTARSAVARIAWDRIWPAWSFGWRCAIHRRIPDYEIRPAPNSNTPVLRSVNRCR